MPQRWSAISHLVVEKRESEKALTATLRFYVESVSLSLDKSLCIKCDVCSKVCPKEAFSIRFEDGKARLALDESKCVLCGACEPLCPSNAIRVLFNGRESNVLMERGGFPTPLKKLVLDPSKCPEGCAEAASACPRGALKVTAGAVELDGGLCLRCPWCEDACKHGAIRANPLFLGRISIDNTKCTKDCDTCSRVCPTAAIKMEGGKAIVTERYCVFCNTCSLACKDMAIDVKRYNVFVGEGFSALWSSALLRLLGQAPSARLLDRASRDRIRRLVSDSVVP